ncbi:MAG: hydrogenase iron-sulfur subunit [Archaeoglobaceae archaeon]
MPETQARSIIIDSSKCVSCGVCVSLCPHGALSFVDRYPEVTGGCKVCGLCVSSCITRAITMAAKKFRDESLLENVGDIVVFSCRRNIPRDREFDASVISLLCSARLDISLLADAFARGAKAVVVSTCGGGCRNYPGSEEAKAKVEAFKRILSRFGAEDRVIYVEGDFSHAVEAAKRFDSPIKNVEILSEVARNRNLRAVVAKMRSVTEVANAYGEKVPKEKYLQILDEAIEKALKVAIVTKSLEGAAKVSEIAEKTSMDNRDVIDTILEMKRLGMVEFDVEDELIVRLKG